MPAQPPWHTQPAAFQHRQPAHPIPTPQERRACITPRATGTTTDMRAAFLVLLLWAVACAHPVPGHEPTHPSTLQQDTTNEDYMVKLGNHLDGGDGRHPLAGPETGDNALARDLTGGNAVDQELGELRGQDVGGQAGQVQHVNQVDHEDTGAHNGNDLGFLEADARDTDDGVRDHYGAGGSAFPSQGGGFLDEEDDSGDDTLDANGQEERGEGPTYVAGADGAGAQEHDGGRGDGGAGGGHGDSSSSSSSESGGAEHRYRSYGFGRAYRHGGASSSSQEEESYDFQDEAMQGDDPSVFDGPGSSYRMRHAGPRALGNSWESARGAGSHRWEEGDSRSPEGQDGDSGEDSPSLEDNSQSEEPVDSQSEEKSSSPSGEDGDGEDSPSREDGDGEDSPSREDEDSESRESTEQQSEEEPRETPEVVRTLNEHSNSQTWEGQEGWDSAEDRSVLSTPDSESREEEGELSKSREDDDEQSQSAEDTAEESEEGEDDSAESPESPEGDSSPEDNTGEDSRSAESDNSESQEEDGEAESRSQEDGSPESSSHGDDSSLQSLESEARRRRPGALRHRPAADYDDNDCQDGF